MNRFVRYSVIITFILLLAACGEDSLNGGGCNTADTPTVISAFTVIGSITPAGGSEVIDNTTDFTLS